MPNVLALVEAVRSVFLLPFEEGLEPSAGCSWSSGCRWSAPGRCAMSFAEREVAEDSGHRPGGRAARNRSAAVIGAGTMGGGIAMCFANAGIPVTLIETAQDAARQRP